MGISSIITFLSPSLENYWGAPGPPGHSPGYGTVIDSWNEEFGWLHMHMNNGSTGFTSPQYYFWWWVARSLPYVEMNVAPLQTTLQRDR